MECPACNKPVTQSPAPDGGVNIYCSHCGWGAMPSESARSKPQRPPIWQVLLLWVAAIVIVVGPYLGLMYGIPELLDVGPEAFDDASGRLVTLVRYNYWWVMGAYILISVVFTPTYDRENIGFFGGFMDNPFSLQDDWERQKRTWQFLLLPGKTVWAAFVATKLFLFPK